MKNKILRMISVFILLAIFTSQVDGQYFENPKKKESFKDKLFFGGGIGLQFGQVTLIDVAPIIGYKLTERFQTGIGLSYSYYNDKRYNFPVESYTYGGSVFTRFFLFEGLFAQAEAEALNIEVYDPATTYSKREWIENYLVGGGYFQKIGDRSGMYLLVLWNLNQTDLTPYSNPVIRIGFNF